MHITIITIQQCLSTQRYFTGCSHHTESMCRYEISGKFLFQHKHYKLFSHPIYKHLISYTKFREPSTTQSFTSISSGLFWSWAIVLETKDSASFACKALFYPCVISSENSMCMSLLFCMIQHPRLHPMYVRSANNIYYLLCILLYNISCKTE